SVLSSTLPSSWFTSNSIIDIINNEIVYKDWIYLGPITRFFKDINESHIQYDFGIKDSRFFILCEHDENSQHVSGYLGDYQTDVITNGKKLDELNQIATQLTETGLIFINFQRNPKASLFDHFGPVLSSLINKINFRKLRYKRTLIYTAKYNFMTFLDGYQECLHCSYTHPLLSKNYNLSSYEIKNHKHFSQHIALPDQNNEIEVENDQTNALFLYFFPISTLNIYGGGMNCFRVIPINKNTSRMEIDYYFDNESVTGPNADPNSEFEKYFRFCRQVQTEDLELCEATQENLDIGVYQSGTLNPHKENGVIFYQGLIRDRVV
ncbi:uncharacterized protein ASCRUDRAFT_22970, partial [Ascoidea rubescens DSM 1968]